jgi:uncharacterized membrane protein
MDSEHKKKVGLERFVLFSDAVFAIAITLLVIELHLPEMKEISSKGMNEALAHMIPHFFSFFLSFFIIGIYWIAHHRMFSDVVNYDNGLLWLNLVLLCFIGLMPFVSHVYGVYGNVNTAFYMYTINITLVALFNFLIYKYIANPKRKLSRGLEDPRLLKYYTYRAWAVPACFLFGVILSIVIPHAGWSLLLSRMSPILIWPVMSILRRRFADVAQKAVAVE